MPDPTNQLAARLKAWANGRKTAEVARILGAHWNTCEDWMEGRTIPRDRDLLSLSHATGIPVEELRQLATADRDSRRHSVPEPVTIDTPADARAWIEKQDPTPTTATEG